jgi:hypothetical protein
VIDEHGSGRNAAKEVQRIRIRASEGVGNFGPALRQFDAGGSIVNRIGKRHRLHRTGTDGSRGSADECFDNHQPRASAVASGLAATSRGETGALPNALRRAPPRREIKG